MKGKGLTINTIIDTASKLVEEKGYDNFSVRELALRLHVKAASLYNHIEGVDDINREVGKHAASLLNQTLADAIADKERDQAVEALAYAFRNFVKENYELYRSIIGLPTLDQGDGLREIGRDSLQVVRDVVHQYELPERDAIHFSRCFRGVLHGFVTLETSGYYTATDFHAEESFQFMINGYINWLHQLEKRTQEGVAEVK